MRFNKSKVNLKEISKVMKNHQKVEEFRKKEMYQNLMNRTTDKISKEQDRLDRMKKIDKSTRLNGKGFLH